MIKVIAHVNLRKKRAVHGKEAHQARVKGLDSMHRSMSNLLDTHSSLGMNGMLDTSIDTSIDIMDSCDGVFGRRGSGPDKLQPVSAHSMMPAPHALSMSFK